MDGNITNDNSNNNFGSRNGYGNKNGIHSFTTRPTTSNTTKKVDELIDYKKILSLLGRYKWFIFFFIILSTAISVYLAYFYLSPIYQSSSTILISVNQNPPQQPNSELGNIMTSTYGVGSGNSLNNAIEVLKSQRLASEVAQQLREIKRMPDGQLYPILWMKYPLDSTMVSEGTLAYRIQKRLKIEQSKMISDVVHLSFESVSPIESYRLVNLAINAFKDISVNQTRLMAHSALVFLNDEKAKVQKRLEEAEANLSTFMNREKLVELDTQTNELVKSLSELEGERQNIKIKMAATNAAISNYQNQLESIRPGLAEKYSNSVLPTLSGYQYRLAELETERLLILSKNPRLKKNPNAAPELVKINREIRMLRSEVGNLTGDLLKQDDKNPGMFTSANGNIISEVSALRKKLVELNIEKSQLSAQARVLDDRISSYRSAFEKVPANMIQMARRKRDVQMNEQLYLAISKQATEMALWEKTQGTVGQVIDYASIPNTPVKPQKELIVLLGFLVGLILPVGYVVLKENMVTRINSVEKMKNKPYPLLAVIPDVRPVIRKAFSRKDHIKVNNTKVSSYLLTLLDSISPAAESFRRLQSNVIYSQPDDSIRTILVTSSNKEEGKTTLVANFAISLAEEGKKVLIVDCDFRRPSIASMFGIEESPGIIEVLFGDGDPEAVIQETVVRDVHVLSSGRRPPNPAAINRSVKLKNLINSLKRKYDYLILDTPPYGIITDAAPLLKISDGVIMVAKFGSTKETELDLTIENLLRTRANIIGLVLTAFNHKKSSDYYYNRSNYKYSYKSYKRYHKMNREDVKV